MASAAPSAPTTGPVPNLKASVQLGFVIAVVLHLLLLALLTLQWPEPEEKIKNPPMEVDLIAEAAPKSSAPVISESPPPPKLGEVEEIAPPAPPPPRVAPPPPPKAIPAKAPPPKALPTKAPPTKAPPAKAPPAKAPPAKAPPAKAPPAKRPPTGRLDGITDGLTKAPPAKAPPAKGVPAAQTAAEVRKSIDVSIKGAVVPRWNSCRITGVDIGNLSTEVKFRLSQTGALQGFTSVTTSGQNDSNRFQVQRHQECAKRAVELAAPFDLPAENYDFWRNYTLDFVKR
jgi:protein TonB